MGASSRLKALFSKTVDKKQLKVPKMKEQGTNVSSESPSSQSNGR